MIVRRHHLGEERLLDCYFAERTGEGLDPPAAEHLADCSGCSQRYTALVELMETARLDAEAEADAIFTPERLRVQQRQIAARLEHVANPAHVLAFPTRIGHRMTATTSRIALKWVAAAAAAGLFVGVGVGRVFDSSSRAGGFGRPPIRITAPSKPGAPAASPAEPAATVETPALLALAPVTEDDDVFLSELELALDRPRTQELMPFDAFTPHVRDITTRLR